MKKIAVIGLGYVGLPTLVAIAKSKLYQVIGFDLDKHKIDLIKRQISPIEDKIVRAYLQKHHLEVSDDETILEKTDIFIICVPTPVYDDFTPNYGYVQSATETIAKYLKKGNHFVLESTVNPGTCEEVVLPILEHKTGLKAGVDFNIAHCPERINPGDDKWDIFNINRNIGSIDSNFNQDIAKVYQSFITKAKIKEVSNLKVAESTKIVENTFRDINIAYVNELAKSFDKMGIDLYETLQAASNKPFSFMAHYPGAGVGGHCIAVDPYYLINRALQDGFEHKFLKLAREINNSMPEYVVAKVVTALNQEKLAVNGTKITLLGLSYKPEISDIRESPAIEIKKSLKNLGAKLTIYDPFINSPIKNLPQAIKQAQAIVIATAHHEFANKLPELLKNSHVKVIVDGRNCLDPKYFQTLGINYYGIGRGK